MRHIVLKRQGKEVTTFDLYDLIANGDKSKDAQLLPGDVILTGTPSGVGPIESGDRLEVRIHGLSPLVNTVK